MDRHPHQHRRRASERPSDQRGATLIEIVVATLILSIVAIGMAEFFANGHAGFHQEERKRVGTLLAQEALERTLAQSYGAITSWSETRNVGATTYSVRVISTQDAPELDMKTIRCDVTWNVTSRATRTSTLTTFVYDL